jgi:ketosteroid isomerase-like protein
MQRTMFVFLLLLGTTLRSTPAGSRAQNPQPATATKTAIEAVLSKQQTAWNHGDVVEFMEGYWNSPELSFAGPGGIMRGYQLVLSHYKQSYPDRAAMGQLDFSDLQIRALGDNAALVLGKWHLQRQAGDVGGVFSLVFERFAEGWKIVHDHTSRAAETHP